MFLNKATFLSIKKFKLTWYCLKLNSRIILVSNRFIVHFEANKKKGYKAVKETKSFVLIEFSVIIFSYYTKHFLHALITYEVTISTAFSSIFHVDSSKKKKKKFWKQNTAQCYMILYIMKRMQKLDDYFDRLHKISTKGIERKKTQ